MIPILETPMPNRDEVAFAAFAPLPKGFGEKDRQRLEVAVRVLTDGSQEYSRRAIFNITDGRTVQTTLLPDGVLIRFVVPKGNLSNGIALMEGLLRRPTITAESLNAALRRVQRGEPDYWTASLSPHRNDLKTIGQDEARALLSWVFNPARTVVSAVGGFASGEVQSRWVRLTTDWKPLPEPRYPDDSAPIPPKDNPAGLSTIELRGHAFPVSDPDLPARWLAMIALGVGKGSALFLDVRQVEGWSYRQEAILWPDSAGLVPRLVAVSTPEEGEGNRAEGLRTTLLRSVEAWTEEDRGRALGAATLNLGPFWFGDNGPSGEGLSDRAALEAYWFAKAGVRWDFDALLASMRAVSLESLKAQAQAMLRDAQPIVLPARIR